MRDAQPHTAAERLYPARGIHPSPGMSLQLPGRTILRLSYPDADTRPWRLLPGFSSQDSLTAKEYSHGWVLELQRGNNSTHILHDAKAGCRRPA